MRLFAFVVVTITISRSLRHVRARYVTRSHVRARYVTPRDIT